MILVSGASGVLGKRVVRALQNQNEEDRVVSFVGDISDRESVDAFFLRFGRRAFTSLIHLAAIVSTAAVSNNPEYARATNVTGTANLLSNFWSSCPGAHVTCVSTSHVYASSNYPIDESSRVAPISLYGHIKLEAEEEAVRLQSQNEGGLCIPRLFSFFSADQHPDFLYPSIVSRLESQGSGSRFRLRGWNNVRDFSTADYMALAVTRLSLERVSGVVNVGSGLGETIGDFARRVTGQDLEFCDSDQDPKPTTLVSDISRMRSLFA